VAALLTAGSPADIILADITKDTMRAAFAAYAATHEAPSIRRAWSTWNARRQCLRELASHPTLTHQVLDRLPAGHTTNYVRGLLVEHGALPSRDERLARSTLDGTPSASNSHLLDTHRYQLADANYVVAHSIWIAGCQRSNTRRSPRSTSLMMLDGTSPIRSDRSVLLSVTSAVTLTTESRGSPVATAGRNTLPGIAAKAVFEVITAAITVARRLALYGSDWITRTGRRLAGRLPDGAPRSAQWSSARLITTRRPLHPIPGVRRLRRRPPFRQ